MSVKAREVVIDLFDVGQGLEYAYGFKESTMEQPVPTDRIEQAWKAYSGYSRPAPFVSRDHEVSFEAFSQGYRAAMADLQELREALGEIAEHAEVPVPEMAFSGDVHFGWIARRARAALARLEGR